MIKEMKEWFFDVPWGKIALVSWGKQSGAPILLVHGHLDSAATFIPLLEHLPDNYYYVGLDLPGHGKSDPLPVGVTPNHFHLVEVLQRTVEHLKWERFVYITHSMGSVLGILFNACFPGQISKVINLDPGPGIYWFAFSKNLPLWFDNLYNKYYIDLNRLTNNNPKLYTYESAKQAIIRNRNLTEKQAEIILSRNIVPVNEDKLRLSWDVKMKLIATTAISRDFLFYIMTNSSPPVLNIMATIQEVGFILGKKWGMRLLQQVQEATPNYFSVYVESGHDLHITNSEEVSKYIIDFLERDFTCSLKSKL